MHAYGRHRRSRRTMLRVTLYKEEARGARQRAAERAGSVRARLHEGVTVAAHSVGVSGRGAARHTTNALRCRGAHRGVGKWILIVLVAHRRAHEVAGGATAGGAASRGAGTGPQHPERPCWARATPRSPHTWRESGRHPPTQTPHAGKPMLLRAPRRARSDRLFFTKRSALNNARATSRHYHAELH